MPVKRRAGKARLEFTRLAEVHLTMGDCLMPGRDSCACGLSDAEGKLREDRARAFWRIHRTEILAAWNKVQSVDWYRRTDDNHGFGQFGIPCFAECVFDGRELPELNPSWPEAARNHWGFIAAALDGGLPRPAWRK